MKKQLQKGFTLIELMIVVAIIGILASIALPAYQNFIVKGQISEGPIMAAKIKSEVQEIFDNDGVIAPDFAAIYGVGEPEVTPTNHTGTYVSQIDYDTGSIAMTYATAQAHNNLAGANVLVVEAATNNLGDFAWVCGYSPVPAGHTLTNAGAVPTTVLRKYLPSSCK